MTTHKIAVLGTFALALAATAPIAAQERVGYEIGTIVSMNGDILNIRDVTNGRTLRLNAHTAMANHASPALNLGESIVAQGRFLPNGIFDAMSIEQRSTGVRRGSEVGTIDSIQGVLVTVTDVTNGKQFTANLYTAAHNGEVDTQLAVGRRIRLDGYWLADDVFDAEHVVAYTGNAALAPRARMGYLVGTIVTVNGDLLGVRDAANGRTLTVNDHTAVTLGRVSGPLRTGERIRLNGRWLGNGVFDAEDIRIL